MRTLSARILLGFAALTVTFAVITATLVDSLGQVEDQVILMGKGYVPLALKSKELSNRQDDLRNYLEKQLAEESNVVLARANINRYKNARDRFLLDNRKVLDDLEKLIEIDPRQFTDSRPRLEALEKGVAALEPLYADILAAPPLAMFEPANPQILAAFLLPAPLQDAKREQAAASLKKLLEEERKLFTQTNQLASRQERNVSHMTLQLQENEHILRVRTFYLGISAVVLGLIVTMWVVVTLRPLRRLRDGARRIAAGDYANRIPETGPAEVADLAREFNVMGRAVEERERELVRSERLAAVGKMAAMITHEVRNPLSSIGLNTELLEDELSEKNGEARELCRAIHREVDRLTAITEEYLAFARLPKPKLAAEPIHPMVGALAAFIREDLAARDVKLVTELAAGDPVAQIDAGQIRQCLINLIRNAADAVVANKGGKVILRTRSAGKRIEISVIDDGVGIPGDVLPRLFDPFFSTKEGGSGLGLALTQQIVRDHGGDLAVASTVGVGTTFTLSVPATG
ncbi:MAG: HAMP domain-containing protein [Deltaproteobacteria bacterium]|nr:HAMP domain-containing protein [Deltaproteobacteria bacterium]